jgi:triacylglycerol lipase
MVYSFGTHITSIPTTSLQIPKNLDIVRAEELMQLCVYTYDQYDEYTANQNNNKTWTIPAPFKVEKMFYVYEKGKNNISKKIPFGFIAKNTSGNNKNIYICFRGTKTASEWEQDAKIQLVPLVNSILNDKNNKNIKVHKGFQEVYTNPNDVDIDLGSLQNQMRDYLKTIKTEDYNNLWVTGHSLGGAVATLAVIDIVTNTIHKGAKMYNFASPLVGNQEFVNFFKENIGTNQCNNNSNNSTCSWRIVNINDLVPKFPESILGYVHVNGCSGTSMCNNIGDNLKNGVFEIKFAEKCTIFLKNKLSGKQINPLIEDSCLTNAHSANGYLNKLKEIKVYKNPNLIK